VLPGAWHGNLLAITTYRKQERIAAFEAMMTNHSPETVAAFNEEMRLATRYHNDRQFARSGVIFAILLLLDGFGIYFFGHYVKRKAA
jgi:hypothetical protein